MKPRHPLRLLFYLNVAAVALMLGYKLYLNYFLPEFRNVHTDQLQAIDARLAGREAFRFAVVGNINNAIGIFQNRMIPRLNAADLDFLVSAGNAVSTGGEDKYQSLHGMLEHLEIPYLLTFGEHEHQRFGSYRFYEHYGPHYFSFKAAGARFIFLDSTGKTSWRWQLRWLSDLLAQDDSRHRFVFIGHPLFRPKAELLFEDAADYLQPPAFRSALLEQFRKHQVDAVFSANLGIHDEQVVDGTRFITTGGAGGLLLEAPETSYHHLEVSVTADGFGIEPVLLEGEQHPVLRVLERLWMFIYSLFYVGYLNFILLLSVLTLVALKLYQLLFRAPDFYPDYDLDPTPWLERPLRVVQFTNNYLPFIGGVPISIDRLRQGLTRLGDQVLVVAPHYHDQPAHEPEVLRVPSLVRFGINSEFRMANIFLPRISRQVRAFRPDLIHVHHPFWLGSLGLLLARLLNVPAIYTYHTRLEHYAHYVPLPGLLFRNLISHALVRRFSNKCDAVVVPTHATDEYLRMIGVTTPLFVQPTGIDYDRFQQVDPAAVAQLRTRLGIDDDETVFISVSRLSREKNIDFMLDALAGLQSQTTRRFRMLMIGDGNERKRLQGRIDELELGDCVQLVGAVPADDMPLWYQLGDAFLFASKSETQGMVILEAMAAGLPVVAVRASGIDDIVREGHNGFKTPEVAHLWRAKVQRLLEDEALRHELGEHALAFAADYSIEAFAESIREVYAIALAGRAAKR